MTIAALARFDLDGMLAVPGLTRIPRLGFRDFVPLMRTATFLVTDSGGSQEEAFYLDLPCLVHRKRTERQEGLGENILLSDLDIRVLDDFLRDPGMLPPDQRARAGLPVRCHRR